MGIVQHFQHGHYTRKDLTNTVLRVILGLILLGKGIAFLSNAEELRQVILDSQFRAGAAFLVSYVIFAHLFGGVFIIIGLFTRIVALLQLPILIGALFFIIPGQGISEYSGEFFLSVFVLLLLVYILVSGPGDLSMDDYLRERLL